MPEPVAVGRADRSRQRPLLLEVKLAILVLVVQSVGIAFGSVDRAAAGGMLAFPIGLLVLGVWRAERGPRKSDGNA